MRARLLVVVVASLTSLVACSGVLARPQAANTQICRQIKGPANNWQLPASVATGAGIPRAVKGTTWTVFATGVQCATAVKLAPAYLKQWAANHSASAKAKIPGWLCSVDRSQGPSGSDGGGCVRGSSLSYFQLIETGPYSIAQLKQIGMGR
jgi:hypothetical protein